MKPERLPLLATQVSLISLALASAVYAIVTAPSGGKDLHLFQLGGQKWVEGSYVAGGWPLALYPPFVIPIFAPLSLVPFDLLVFLWLALNIVATILTINLATKLYGSHWPAKAQLYTSALVLAWAPFRVTLRLGQISLMIIATLLAGLLARKRNRPILAGLLVGLSLWKYSMTFPFLLYFVWRREWKLVSTALVLPAIFAGIFALRLGVSPLAAFLSYGRTAIHAQAQGDSGWKGTTEIKLLILSLSGNSETTFVLTILVIVVALFGMAVVFRRTPNCENVHFATLALFSLWWTYHRTYDSVFCVLPLFMLTGMALEASLITFARFWLAGLGLLIVSVPGLLTQRLGMSEAELSATAAGWLGLHSERLLVFGMFWSFLWILFRRHYAFSCNLLASVNGRQA